jgi:hypothetical protein|eukprot:COSAG01_NODE_10170_length_2231_cov_29.499531_2_plen_257_part_00
MEAELADVRATLEVSTQLCNIGRRLGLAANLGAPPSGTAQRAVTGAGGAGGRGARLRWLERGGRQSQLDGLKEKVARLGRLSKGQTEPAPKPRPRPGRRPDELAGRAAANLPAAPTSPASPATAAPGGALEALEPAELNAKIDRMIAELGRLSPRRVSPIFQRTTARASFPAKGGESEIRAQADKLGDMVASAATRAADLRQATAGLERLWADRGHVTAGDAAATAAAGSADAPPILQHGARPQPQPSLSLPCAQR